jgi:hypothetical protein
MYTLKERIIVHGTGDDMRLAGPEDKRGTFLLGPAGYKIEDSLARRLGLLEKKEIEKSLVEDKAEDKVEDKGFGLGKKKK